MQDMSSAPPPLQGNAGLRASLAFAVVTLVLFGLLYSLLGAGIGRALFPAQAQGSLVERDGKVLGSAMVAQPFADARYFQPRASASNYDPMAAAGSNRARSNPELQKRIAEAMATVAARERIAPAEVPDDLVTESGSGLDPDITPAGARVQIARVAHARGLDPAVVERLVAQAVEPKEFRLFGRPRVNVLRLNLALDALPR